MLGRESQPEAVVDILRLRAAQGTDQRVQLALLEPGMKCEADELHAPQQAEHPLDDELAAHELERLAIDHELVILTVQMELLVLGQHLIDCTLQLLGAVCDRVALGRIQLDVVDRCL